MTPPDTHEYVDLGLPSGTLWATCNVGANSPEEKGDYFAWGETAPKDYYDWSTYKWCNIGDTTLTKYCNSDCGYNGFVDNKMELDPEDDAAYVNWGPSWRTPTKEQLDELRENCTIELTYKGGYRFTGPNGNTIVFPCSGYRYQNQLDIIDSEGVFLSRTLDSSNPYNFFALDLIQNYFYCSTPGRYYGMPVRPVRVTE